MSDGVPSDGRPLYTASGPCEQVLLDLRRPRLLDDREQLLKVKAGHADIFVVGNDNRRRHLFRVEADDIVLDLHTPCANSGLQIIAIGGPGAELISLPRTQLVSVDALARWISHLARLVIPPAIAGTMLELVTGEAFEMQAGHARRGPMRSIAWTRVAAGSAKLLGLDPALNPGDQPLPLVGGLWIQAGESGCRVLADAAMPEAPVLWPAVDKIHLAIVSILAMGLAEAAALERQRLSQRIELTQSQTLDSLERLAEMVVGKSVLGEGSCTRRIR